MTSDKPDEIHPEAWKRMSRKQMTEAQEDWKIKKSLRDAAREARKLVHPVPLKDVENYHLKLKEVQDALRTPLAPQMPILSCASPEQVKESLLSGCKFTSKVAALKEVEETSLSFRSSIDQHGHREKVPGRSDVTLPFLNSASCTDAASNFLMVHKQLQPHEWRKIGEAVDAVNAEWKQLDDITAWDYGTVCNHSDKCKEAEAAGRQYTLDVSFPYAT